MLGAASTHVSPLEIWIYKIFKVWTMEASVAGHNIIAGTAPDSEFWEHSLLIISYTTNNFESKACLQIL